MSDSTEYTNVPGQRLDLPDPNVTARGKGITGMEYKIIGTVLQAVILELDPGETVFSESGGMVGMANLTNRCYYAASRLTALSPRERF